MTSLAPKRHPGTASDVHPEPAAQHGRPTSPGAEVMNLSTAAIPSKPTHDIVGMPPSDAQVILYTAAFDSQIAVKTLAVLREFAYAQGWTVVHELYDLVPPGTPRRHRTAWCAVERALTQGEVTGVVAPAEQEIAWHPGDRTALRVWLLGVPAFAAYPHAGRRPQDVTDTVAVPAEVGGPVDRQWSRSYALRPRCLRKVKTDAFAYLTVLGWPGNVVAAVGVLARLAKNAIIHAAPVGSASAEMHVVLAVTEDDELRIDVHDPSPEFRDSAAALNGEKGRGLRDVRLLGAEVTWSLAEDGRSKTVRARMAPGEVPV
ncbi:ATP-binding protein [Streptomyces viridochromogenes]|uniref:ATP-binding protein n=1 Tax=Streptomyces viridochromogenes TaxID=1938 RepID=UPI00065CA37C|nr:ATP-binding protein [Streptomyces viridochromogenes]